MIRLSPCMYCSLYADLLAQNLTLRVRSIGPRHKGHRGGALDMMSSAHDSHAHCMRHKKSAESALQHRHRPSPHNHTAAHKVLHIIDTTQMTLQAAQQQAPSVPSLSDEANALVAAWAHQVTAVEEHDDSIIVDADRAEVLILFLTATLRWTGICAGRNLHQHDVPYLHNLVSVLRMCTRTHVRATSWQSAARSNSERAVVHTALCKDVLA